MKKVLLIRGTALALMAVGFVWLTLEVLFRAAPDPTRVAIAGGIALCGLIVNAAFALVRLVNSKKSA